jgi:uncharacterized repeat protein (TIGR01451 family)
MKADINRRLKSRLNFKRNFSFGFLLVLLLFSISSALPPPQNLDAKANPDSQSVSLTWSPVGNAVGFNVYRKERTDPSYQKLNASILTNLNYTDRQVARGRGGRDYLYMIRSLDSAGLESADSIGVGAPLMTMTTTAKIMTTRDKPLTLPSVKTGKPVTFATTGDMVIYQISYSNQGYSSAKEVKIDYAIPEGTVITGVPRVIKGARAEVSYYDRSKKAWLDKINREEDVQKVRFSIMDAVSPVAGKKEISGIIILNVIINK